MPTELLMYYDVAYSTSQVEEEKSKYNCVNCKAPCCKFHVGVNAQEVNSKKYMISWQPGYPILARKSDGSCVYQRPDGSCGIYNRRPWICRTYTCEHDTRINDESKYKTGRPNVESLFPEEKNQSKE